MISERSPLHAVQRLIQQQEYARAAALAEYYPATLERRVLECIALLLQGNRADAASLMPASAEQLPAFTQMLNSVGGALDVGWKFLGTAANPRENSYLNYVCLNLVALGGDYVADHLSYAWRNLARHGMEKANWELARMAVERALEIDASPLSRLEVAKLALRFQNESPAEHGWQGPSYLDLVKNALASANRENAQAEFFPEGAFLLLTLDPAAEREAAGLVKRGVSCFPDELPVILGGCIRLAFGAVQAEQSLVREQMIRIATNLVGNLAEYLEARVQGIEGYVNVLRKERNVFSSASWYSEGAEREAVLCVLARSPRPPDERELLHLTKLAEFPPDWLVEWVIGALARREQLSPWEREKLAEWAGTLPYHPRLLVMEALFQVSRRDVRPTERKTGTDTRPRADARAALDEWFQRGQACAIGRPSRRDLGVDNPPAVSRRKQSRPKRRRLIRFTRVRFPEFCELEQKAELTLQLTARAPTGTRVLQKVGVDVETGVKEVSLTVLLTSPGFAVESPVRTMRLPVQGDSEEVVFPLFPLSEGEKTLEIEVFYGTERVTYLRVRTHVTNHARGLLRTRNELQARATEDGAAPEHVEFVERFHNAVHARPRRSAFPADRRVLHATWLECDDKLLYRVIGPDRSDEFAEAHHRPGLRASVCDEIRRLNEFLYELVTYDHPDDAAWEALKFNMGAKARALSEFLLPERLRERIAGWPADSTLIVDTNEQWIPWEILHDGSDYLGMRFVLARAPRADQRARFLCTPPRTQRPGCTLSRIVNVVGGEVETRHADRAARTFHRFSPPLEVEVIREQPVTAIRDALTGADALHLTCHGLMEPHLLQVANTSSQVVNLLPESVQMLPLKQGSVVFANACESDRALVMFGRFTSFGWEFYRHGADVFIGTLGAVPTMHAVYFAEKLYTQLLSGGGSTVGEVVQQARRLSGKRRNLFALLYCLYGDPATRVSCATPRADASARAAPARLEPA